MHEASLYGFNRMATFTYDDASLPRSGSLEYGDFQLMMKRLRWSFRGAEPGPNGKFPIRFFCAGEYGSKRKRPHFHAILFNVRFPDERTYENGTLWSAKLEELWSKGHVQLDPVTEKTASYVSGYALKKVYGRTEAYEDVVDTSTGELFSRRKEFVTMSRRPGVGAWWFERYGKDLFPGDAAVMLGGKRNKVPGYYWKRYRSEGDPCEVEDLEQARYERAYAQRDESRPERRAVREEYQLARLEAHGERKDL